MSNKIKIVPNWDILVEGAHAPAGVSCECSALVGRLLIAQGIARPAPAEEVAVEKADAAPEAETAAARPPRKTKTAAAS